MTEPSLPLTDHLISPATTWPMTLDYAKLHIRAFTDVDDALVSNFIAAATQYFEEQTGRQLVTATREVWLDAFPSLGASGWQARIELPHPPLQSVVSVQYVDSDGLVQSFSDGGSPAMPRWQTAAPAGPFCRRGWIEPLPGTSWPIAREETAAVRIRYVCGYGDTQAEMPPLALGVLGFLVGHFDTFRSAVHPTTRGSIDPLPFGVDLLLNSFKGTALPTQLLRPAAPPPLTGTSWL